MEKLLVVLFPGFGYGPDKPLLHYAEKCAKCCGYDVCAVHYRDLDMDTAHSLEERALNSMEGAVRDALEIIAAAGDYKRMLFVSKSFGTFVAGKVQERLSEQNISVFQIFLTPLPMTYDWYMKGQECISVTGLLDPLMTQEARDRMAEDPRVMLLAMEGCNHSMEDPADPVRSVKVLEKITEMFMDAMQKQKSMLQ